MAAPSVKTVQFTDPRIEPQADPVYDYVVAPTQNQYYKISASSLSNSSITFNNLTTLGVDRAYLDTFELELTCTIRFTNNKGTSESTLLVPAPNEWTFDSFPFNKCCEEAHVNINGGAFFSQPLSYIRAKERYMDQYALSNSYENICPCHRPLGQTESGDDYSHALTFNDRRQNFLDWDYMDQIPTPARRRASRYGAGLGGHMLSEEGLCGAFNNAIVGARDYENPLYLDGVFYGYPSYHFDLKTINGMQEIDWEHMIVTVTWREPIFCSPFSSRYDATYGRPLYNITSMDLTFTMQNLGNMIRLMRYNTAETYVTSYTVNIDSAQLCYQVMTIPPVMKKPLTTLVPYRRFIPYITDYQPNANSGAINRVAYTTVSMSSGVYTMNEVPTAIWIFMAPSKAVLQSNVMDSDGVSAEEEPDDMLREGNWDSNKLFASIRKISISLANTTQILNTAQPPDLYRIAKANGCEDSYLAWSGGMAFDPRAPLGAPFAADLDSLNMMAYANVGSVLRLKPGVDLIIPDQALIPGANANNMVFQVTGEFVIPPHSTAQDSYSLWLLFEYVGVAAISPGQCEITMNPLGSGEIMAASPIVSATSAATEGKLEGSGVWDTIRKNLEIAQHIAKDTGIVPRIIKSMPKQNEIRNWLGKEMGGPAPQKRRRGGAVIGKGLQDWSV